MCQTRLPDPILPTPPTNRLPASIYPLRTFHFWPISNTQIQTRTQTLKIQKQKLPNKTACVPISSKFPLLPNCQNSEPNTITNSNLRTSFKNTHRLPAALLVTIMMIRTIEIILITILVTLVTLITLKKMKTFMIFMMIVMMMMMLMIMLTLMIPRRIKTGGSWRWWWTACSCGSSELLLWSVRMMIVVIKLTAMMMRMTSKSA